MHSRNLIMLKHIKWNSANNSTCLRFVSISVRPLWILAPAVKKPSYVTAVTANCPMCHFSTKSNPNCSSRARVYFSLLSHRFSIVSKQLSAVAADPAVVKLMRGLHSQGVSAAAIPTALLDQTFHCRHNRPLLVSLFTDRPLQQVTCGDQCQRMNRLSVFHEIQ